MDSVLPNSERKRPWNYNPDLWCPLLLLFSWALFFSDPLFSSSNFYFRDILNFHYPLRKVLIDSYASGEFPLWNPYIFLGQPLLANPNYLAFYPTNLFHLFVPFDYAFKLHFLIHPLLGGLGCYFLQRRLGLEARPAFAGSLIYQFSGPVLSFLNLYTIAPAVALLPWAGWSFLRALQANGWTDKLLFGAILGLQIVSFEPLMFQCIALLLAGLGVLHILESVDRRKAAGRILWTGLTGAAFGLALGALQVIPTLELLPLSARISGYDYSIQSRWSMHAADFLNLIVPNLFGNPYTVYRVTYWGERYHDMREPYLVSFFVGTVTVLFGCLSALSARRKLKLTAFGIVLLSSLLAVGKFNPMYHWFYQHVPVFRLGRYPSKYFLIATLALAILAALGLEVLLSAREASSSRKRRIRAFGLGGLVVAAIFIGFWLCMEQSPEFLGGLIRANLPPGLATGKDFPWIASQLMSSTRSAGVFLLLSSGFILASPLFTRQVLLPVLAVSIAGAELMSSNMSLTPLISAADVGFVSEVNLYLQKSGLARPYRVVSLDSLRSVSPPLQLPSSNRSWAWFTYFFRMTGQPMYGIMNGIQYSFDQSVDYLNTVESDILSKACSQLPEAAGLTLLEKVNSPLVLTLNEIQDARAHQLDSFEALTTGKLKVYELDGPLPRAYFVAGSIRAPSHMDAMRVFLHPNFHAREEVILEGPQVVERAGVPESGTAGVVDYRSNRVVCEVDAKTSGFLVLLDTYYPGWRAYVDGRDAEILRANFAFRAVAVTAGKHRIEFVYRPQSFYAGLTVTSLALLFGVVALFRHPRRRSLRDGEAG